MLHHEQRKGSVEPFLFCCNICWARTREGASVAKGAGDALSSERSEAVHIRRRGRRLQAPALQPVEPPMLHHEQRKGSAEPFLFCCNICWARTREGARIAKGAGDTLSSERSEAVHMRRRGRRLQAPALQPVEPPMLHHEQRKGSVEPFLFCCNICWARTRTVFNALRRYLCR